jgi:hypothetical protein
MRHGSAYASAPDTTLREDTVRVASGNPRQGIGVDAQRLGERGDNLAVHETMPAGKPANETAITIDTPRNLRAVVRRQ